MRKSLRNYTAEKCAERRAEDVMAEYGNMSEDALFARLMEEVSSAKSEGSFDAASLKRRMDAMRPYLNEAQINRLDHLLRLIGC